jgi:hypothetical protein
MRAVRVWWIAGAAVLLAVGIVFFRPGKSPSLHRPPAPAAAEIASPPRESSAASAKPMDPKRTTVLTPDADGFVVWPGAASASEMLNQPDQSAREDIQAVHTMLADYHFVFGEVPLGGLNEEITRGLRGDNPKKIIFLTARAGGASASGALLDRWGTPYFFHKLSRDVIDLRSAGPDHKFWTADDVFEESSGGPPL